MPALECFKGFMECQYELENRDESIVRGWKEIVWKEAMEAFTFHHSAEYLRL